MPGARLVCVIALATVALFAPRSPAGCDDPTWAQLGAAPADADVAILVNDMGALAGSPNGRAMRAAIAQAGLFTETYRRWSALAEQLGLDAQGALDELLGRRVMFVCRGLERRDDEGARPPPDWAVVTSISKRGEKLVRDRLRPAPRAKIAAQPVLATEHGRFLLALVERFEGGRAQTELILCPDESADLLESLVLSRVGAKGAPRSTLAGQKEFALTRQLPRGEALAAVRLRSHDAGDVFVAASVGSTRAGWRVELALDEPAWLEGAGERSIDPRVFAALERDALVLVAEALAGPERSPTGAQTLVWPVMITLPGDLGRLLTGRSMLRLDRAPPTAPAPLRLSIASQTPHGEDPAVIVDRAIGAMVESVGGADPPEGVIEGEFPHAVRTRRLTLPYTTPLGRDALASWAFGFSNPADKPSWWTLTLSPEDATSADASNLTRAIADLVASPSDAGRADLVAAGVVLPRGLAEAVADQPWALLPQVGAMRRIERVRWRFEAPRGDGPDRDGLVRGRVDVEMNIADPDLLATPDPGAP